MHFQMQKISKYPPPDYLADYHLLASTINQQAKN